MFLLLVIGLVREAVTEPLDLAHDAAGAAVAISRPQRRTEAVIDLALRVQSNREGSNLGTPWAWIGPVHPGVDPVQENVAKIRQRRIHLGVDPLLGNQAEIRCCMKMHF